MLTGRSGLPRSLEAQFDSIKPHGAVDYVFFFIRWHRNRPCIAPLQLQVFEVNHRRARRYFLTRCARILCSSFQVVFEREALPFPTPGLKRE
jgi:hypothetical protein